MYSYDSSLLVLLLFSAVLASASSHWINALYRLEPETLSYPTAKNARSRFRQLFLTFSFPLLLLPCLTLPITLFIHHALFFYFLLLTICTDFEQYVIFDKMLIPFALLSIPFFFLLPLPIGSHLLAAFADGAVFLLLAILTRGAIGGGDIKLIFVLGLWMGPRQLITVSLLGFLLGGIAAVFLLITGKKKKRDFFAYGPYFSATAIFLTLT